MSQAAPSGCSCRESSTSRRPAAMEERLAAIEEQEPARVVIDLGGLAFIDSSGLRVLLLADSRARERGRELVLAPGPEPVQRVFEMTGALDVLRFES